MCVNKETRLNIRITPEFKADLEMVAKYHGLTMTSYVHSVLVKKIREEKEREPSAFIQPKELSPKSKKLLPFANPNEEIDDKDEGKNQTG